MRSRRGLFVVLAAPFAVFTAACSNETFSVPGTSADSGTADASSASDATASDSGDSGDARSESGGGGGPFCATHSHDFCADFDDGAVNPPGLELSIESGGIEIDKTRSSSPPNSVVVHMPSPSTPKRALLRHVLAGSPGLIVRVGAAIRLERLAARTVSLIELFGDTPTGTWALALSVETGVFRFSQTLGLSNPSVNIAMATQKVWINVVVEIDTTNSADVRARTYFDGAMVANLKITPSPNTTGGRVEFGLPWVEEGNPDAGAPEVVVNMDNLFVDTP